jgi:LPS-assembly lipoprotein
MIQKTRDMLSAKAPFLLLAPCLLLLSACGFEPVYGTKAGAQGVTPAQGLDQIDIQLIPDAEGVYLRNALIDRFYQGGYPANPRYSLSVDPIKQSKSDYDITVESEATRRQLTLRTRLILRETGKAEAVLTRDVKIVTSYDVIGSQFNTRIAEEDARRAGLNDLARQIETEIALFLGR